MALLIFLKKRKNVNNMKKYQHECIENKKGTVLVRKEAYFNNWVISFEYPHGGAGCLEDVKFCPFCGEVLD